MSDILRISAGIVCGMLFLIAITLGRMVIVLEDISVTLAKSKADAMQKTS